MLIVLHIRLSLMSYDSGGVCLGGSKVNYGYIYIYIYIYILYMCVCVRVFYLKQCVCEVLFARFSYYALWVLLSSW